MRTSISAFVAAAGAAAALLGCGGGSKTYDIGPIFPASSDKCARYSGDQKGTGPTASCMVTKDECQKAASDWRKAMQNSGVNDAVDFTCK